MAFEQARYQILVYSPWTGEQLTTITNWNTLHLERNVNNFDNMILTLDGNDPKIRFFTEDAILEVRRRISRAGQDWYTESTLLHRTPQSEVTETGRYIFTSYSRGLIDLIRRRNILYYANTSQTLKSDAADTVMKEIVTENCASGANIPDRRSYGIYMAPITGLSVQPSSHEGPNWHGAITWENVLDQLQEIALASSVDFDVIKTGPVSFQFATFHPQRGVDRSDTVLFSLRYNNMANVSITTSKTEVATVVAVLGQGQEDARNVVIRGPTIAAGESPWGIIETTRDARTQPNLVDMMSQGDAALAELKAQEIFTFTPLQTDPRQYGQTAEYWLGDRIKAEFKDNVIVKKITGVTIDVSEGREDIRFDFSDNLIYMRDPLRALVTTLAKRLRALEKQDSGSGVDSGLVF